MISINRVLLLGYVGNQPKEFNLNNVKLVKFSLATSSKYKDKTYTEWHNISAYGKLADICSQYIKKGSHILVEGRIQYNQWTDENGNKKYQTNIMANNIILLDKKESEIESNNITSEDVPF